jgi:hypothetical protein
VAASPPEEASGGLALGPAAEALLARLGGRARAVRLLTPLAASATVRRSYRVDLDDGRTVKLRRARTGRRAATYVGLVRELDDPRLARVLAHHDDLTVEEWVPGVPLAAVRVEDAHLAAAAALLASLHTAHGRIARPLPATVPTDAARAKLEQDLRTLQHAAAIDTALAERLRQAAAGDDPGVAAAGVIHTDLCPENLVVDDGRRLRAVDNEAMRVGPTGFDLAAVWYRWPMTPPEWQRFLTLYARAADPEPALRHFTFWRIAALAKSARVRVINGAWGAETPLAGLRSLAAEG